MFTTAVNFKPAVTFEAIYRLNLRLNSAYKMSGL